MTVTTTTMTMTMTMTMIIIIIIVVIICFQFFYSFIWGSVDTKRGSTNLGTWVCYPFTCVCKPRCASLQTQASVHAKSREWVWP